MFRRETYRDGWCPFQSAASGYAEERFGYNWKLKEEHVPATEDLGWVASDMAHHHDRMRDIEDRQAFDLVRRRQSDGPSRSRPPIVSRKLERLACCNRKDICRQPGRAYERICGGLSLTL